MRILFAAALGLACAMASSMSASAEPGAPPVRAATAAAAAPLDVAPLSVVVAPSLVQERLLSADPAAAHREALRVLRTSLPPQTMRWTPGSLFSPPRSRVPIQV